MCSTPPTFTVLNSKDASQLYLFQAVGCNSCWVSSNWKDFVCGLSAVAEFCCVKEICFCCSTPKDEFTSCACCSGEKGILVQLSCCCCAVGIGAPRAILRAEGQCACLAGQGACPCTANNPLTCAVCGFSCIPAVGCCVKKAEAWDRSQAQVAPM